MLSFRNSVVSVSGFCFVCIGGGGAAFPWSKYFVGSNLAVSVGGCSTGSVAVFLWSKLVGSVVEVEDWLCVDYVGGFGAAFLWNWLRQTSLYHKFMHHVKRFCFIFFLCGVLVETRGLCCDPT